MLTKQQIIPQFPPSGDARIDGLAKWVYDGLQRLQQKGVLYLDEANIVARNGLIFPATQVAQSDPNTLDDYEEGTWTPADGSGAALTLTATWAKYVKVGRLVTVGAKVTYPATASGATATISGLPFAPADQGAGTMGADAGTGTWLLVATNSTLSPEPPAGGGIANSVYSGKTLWLSATYQV